MPSFEQARKIVLEHVRVLEPEHVPVLDAVGRVLAEDVVASCDLPRWDNSAMDGYAVGAAACVPGARLAVRGYIPAGAPAGAAVTADTAAKIFTGAPLPRGADAVVPVEDADERDGIVVFRAAVRRGDHVRRKGEDVRAGDTVVGRGTVMGPAEVSMLAAITRLAVPVVRRARVAILSTGDELVEPGGALAPGKIYDSNGLALAAAVRELGGEPVNLGIAPDDRAALRRLLEQGLRADALVTSAGVSVGDRDLVREVLEAVGVRPIFWKVDIKPGRPTAFAVRGAVPVFSLPGNPVAALLTFEQFVRPALLRMMGNRDVLRPIVRAIFQEGVRHKPGRVSFLRVRLERRSGGLLAWMAGDQATGRLRTTLQADGIAVIPADWESITPGDLVDVQMTRGGLGAEVA